MGGRWVTTRSRFGKDQPPPGELGYVSAMRLMRPLIRPAGLLVASGALLLAATVAAKTGSADANANVKKAKTTKKSAVEREAEAFLESISSLLQPVATATNDIDWIASTDVTAEHTAERAGADKARAALVGSKTVIEKTKGFLKNEKQLDDLTARQLHKLLLAASESPGTIPEVVTKRVGAEARLSSVLDGFTFCLQPKPGGGCLKPVTANGIDDLLLKSRDLAERQRVWTASKEIGKPLKPGLVELVGLRNQVAREMGYKSYFALKVADYGMSVEEMMALLDDTLATTKPLFDGLHCWAKNTLAARYKRPVPRLIPAHWIGNRWAQYWPGLVEETSLDPLFKGASPESIVKSAEGFYVSLGFARLPPSFWERSDLYPVPPGVARKKNAHASAWNIDYDQDVRSLMSVEPNEQWFGTAHHELGHIYYFLAYNRPEVPFLLRDGANRAFHEAVGELARLASEQTPYLVKVGVMPVGKEPNPVGWLLQSALMESVVFTAFSAGTMSHFERDIYDAELPPSEWQKRWWSYAAQYQGIVAPGPRPDDLCDACTKTHLVDDPASYYDYALATLIRYQLHDHICTKILKQDVRACNYSGNKEVGDFLRNILKLGATRDWRTVIKDATGEPISPRAMMAYFAPLVTELDKRNAGKDCGR
jgi:peptidyl-dipeptidase A